MPLQFPSLLHTQMKNYQNQASCKSFFLVIMGLSINLKLCLLLLCLFIRCCLNDGQQVKEDLYAIDSFTVSERLGPYNWHYIRVELPPRFSSMFVEVHPDIDFELKKINKGHWSKLPVICFRNGGLPLPDLSKAPVEGREADYFYNASTKYVEIPQNAGQCFYIWRGISLEFTTDKIPKGVLFIGLFNGIEPIRTQAKMINRGPAYDLSTSVIVEGCKNQSMRGQFCNQTVEQLSCDQSLVNNLAQSLDRTKMHYDVRLTCNKFSKYLCHGDTEFKTYALDVVRPAEELNISIPDFRPNGAQFINTDGISLICYARYGAMPGNMLYDYAVDLTRMPLVIPLPKLGTWYFGIEPNDSSNVLRSRLQQTMDLCHSVRWQVVECLNEKAGPSCAWEKYMLQVVPSDNSDAFFVYKPNHTNNLVELHNLLLEPLLSNTSSPNESNLAWTFFVFSVERGISGQNIHFNISANASIHCELYLRFGGLPSTKDWDYFYINQTNNSGVGSSMFKLYNASAREVNAYLLYPREGLWSFALRHPVLSNPHSRTFLSLSVESCPNHCSDHGTCKSYDDKVGPSSYRYCFCNCNGRYGGFDCSTQLVSQSAQRWHVIFLTASNAAALFPAVWAIRQKAFAEWIVFTCSGVASAIYHACDVGSWCALPFQVLQFLDFWLSFMGVITTFIYLTFISEASRRAIHTASSIVTALIAVNGPTNSKNIPLVLAIGALCLLFAWLLELFSEFKSNSASLRSRWNLQHRCLKVRSWLPDILKTFNKRFKWHFLLAGFVAMSMAALSWNLENVETYWIWHSAWHMSIYTSAFFFLRSRSIVVDGGSTEATQDDARSLNIAVN